HIHEAADPSIVRIQMLAQFREAGGQATERLAHRGSATFDARLFPGELAERCRNQDLDCHALNPPKASSESDARTTMKVSAAIVSKGLSSTPHRPAGAG